MIVLCILCIVSCSIVFTFYCYVMHCCTVYGQSVEGLHGLRHDQTLKSEVFLTNNSKGIRAPLAPACPPPWKRAGGQLPPLPPWGRRPWSLLYDVLGGVLLCTSLVRRSTKKVLGLVLDSSLLKTRLKSKVY